MTTKDHNDHKKKPAEQPEDWQALAEQYKTGWQRAQADLVNYRKRTEEEKKAFMQFANADVLLQIVEVLDNFKRAAQHVPQQSTDDVWTNWSNGIMSIEKQFETVMQNNGVTQIEVKVGDVFDPTIHEALSSEESDQESDRIVREIEPGYYLHGKVLRPTKVAVSQ